VDPFGRAFARAGRDEVWAALKTEAAKAIAQ